MAYRQVKLQERKLVALIKAFQDAVKVERNSSYMIICQYIIGWQYGLKFCVGAPRKIHFR